MVSLGFDRVDPLRNEEYFRVMMDAEVDAATVIGVIKKGEVDFQILDVRDQKSFEEGHVQGAMNIPLQELSKRIDELDKGRGIVTYCYDPPCMASLKAARILSSQGYRVKDVGGGYEHFVKNDAPVEKGAPEMTH